MNDYKSLIKRLREHGEFLSVSDRMKAPPNVNVRNVFADDYYQAADAIEELSMRLHGDEAAIAGMKCEIERMVVSVPRWIPVTEPPKED